MAHKIWDEIDKRVGHRRLIKEALDERIPGGARWAYVFGSATLILFGVQLVTGIVLAMYYSASATDAWASVDYLEREISMGAFVRGLHHHSAGGMIALVVMHMIQVVLYGAYKAPREANWLSGLALLGLVLAFALTGYLLPWDQTGYWATKVATSIAGTVPLLGPSIQQIAQGGNDYGNLTLTRFYALHVVVLPGLTMGLIGAHIALFRKHGVTPPASMSEEELKKRTERFWPKQVAYDALFSALVLGVLGALAVKLGAPLEAPADPASNFIARPEWYFLFLFQLLKYFEGPLQVVGTVVLPGLAAAFLATLPFLDRGPSRKLQARKPWLGAIGIGLAAVMILTVLAVQHDRNDPTIAEQKKRAHREAQRARKLAAQGVPAAGATYMIAHDPLTRGERLFARECQSCHPLGEKVPKKIKAPDLTGYASKAWIRQALRDPDSHRLWGKTKVEGMKSFHDIPKADLELLIDIVYMQRDPKAPAVDDRKGSDLLSKYECSYCHEFEEMDSLEGPALFGYGTKKWVEQVIADPGQEALFDEMNDMPAFKDRLSEEDRSALAVFLLSLEARADRSKWPFVDDPGPVPTPREPTKAKPEE